MDGALFFLALAQIHIGGFDEHSSGPRARAGTVAGIVIECRFGRSYLFERHPFAHHILNAIANDGDHVAILQHVGFVAKSSVPGDDISAAFLMRTGNREVQKVIQSGDDSVDSAAVLVVDYGMRFPVEKTSPAAITSKRRKKTLRCRHQCGRRSWKI